MPILNDDEDWGGVLYWVFMVPLFWLLRAGTRCIDIAFERYLRHQMWGRALLIPVHKSAFCILGMRLLLVVPLFQGFQFVFLMRPYEKVVILIYSISGFGQGEQVCL